MQGVRALAVLRIDWRFPAQILAVALAMYVALDFALHGLNVGLSDGEAYWLAAMRLREGQPLYLNGLSVPALYWYAPWFAAAWVPLTYLPHGLVMAAWQALLFGSLGVLVYPLLRRPSPATLALCAILAFPLIRTCIIGNVQPLLLAGLAVGLRSGRGAPLVVALAASLKIFPALFAVVFVAEHQWRRLALCVGLTALLWLPALAFDLSRYPAADINPPLPWPLLLLGAGAALLVALRSRRHRLLAASLAVLLAGPRWYHYTPGYLLVSADHAVAHASGEQDVAGRQRLRQ